MANEYIGNPETQGLVRRSRYLEDAIKGLQSAPQNTFNTAEGSIGHTLSNAILAFAGKGASDKADAAMAADRERLTGAILGTPQKTNAAALDQNAPMNLTPGGFEGRAADTETARLRAIAEMGGPMAALQYQQGQAATKYQQDRDKRGDYVTDRGFDFQQGRATRDDFVDDRNFGFQQGRADRQDYVDDRGFETGVDQFGQQMGLSRDQFGETVRHNQATEGIDAATLAAKTAAAANGNAVFDGPQLATIYNKSMGALEDAKARQDDLDAIENASQQFIELTKNDPWLQGGGFGNDLMQAGSMTTSQAKSLTDKIAPLIRKPGSGGNSDNDINMFKSSVVNINNTPEGNQRAAQYASALAGRGRQYVNFLTQTIDPREPQSKQKADALWNLYKDDQPLFDTKTGAVTEVKPFDQWMEENIQAINGAPAQGQGAPVRINSPQERDALPAGTQYIAPDGKVMTKR